MPAALAVQTSVLEVPLPDCAQPGCLKPAQGRRHCAMHARRFARGEDMEAAPQERLDPLERFVQACIDLADCDSESDVDFALALKRAKYAARRWVASEQASQALAQSVSAAVQDPRRGESSKKAAAQAASQRSRQAVREGPEREPARRSGVGEGDARPGGEPRTERDRAVGAADAEQEGAQRRGAGRGGTARPRGTEAVLHRAHQVRRAR